MTKKFIAGGCSFTYGSELSDDEQGKKPSKKRELCQVRNKNLQFNRLLI